MRLPARKRVDESKVSFVPVKPAKSSTPVSIWHTTQLRTSAYMDKRSTTRSQVRANNPRDVCRQLSPLLVARPAMSRIPEPATATATTTAHPKWKTDDARARRVVVQKEEPVASDEDDEADQLPSATPKKRKV